MLRKVYSTKFYRAYDDVVKYLEYAEGALLDQMYVDEFWFSVNELGYYVRLTIVVDGEEYQRDYSYEEVLDGDEVDFTNRIIDDFHL